MNNPIILLTDFGLHDGYVGVLKGVIAKLNPGAHVIDLCHFIEPQNIRHGRTILLDNFEYFPDNSVFCCVIDPGVGSNRKPLVIQYQNKLFIGPDNGLLSEFFSNENIWELPVSKNTSNTFHGRDIFAPWAAKLASNRSLLKQFRTLSINDIESSLFCDVEINDQWQNIDIIYADHFGNFVTNGIYRKGKLEVKLNQSDLMTAKTYSEMPSNTVAAIVGSTNRLEISIKNGSAAESIITNSLKARTA
tara:strand:+ start:664 stop:1404 length:741 start_codon:yes stop_codon:yes gene_type:complete